MFDLVIGLQRWVIRVASYAALMTDVYPPFRLDQGGDDGEVISTPDEPEPVPSSGRRVVPLLLGGLTLTLATLVAATAAVIFEADRNLQDEDGFLMTPDVTYSSSGFAIASAAVDPGDSSMMRRMNQRGIIGDARLTIADVDDGGPLFVGVGPSDDVEEYLSGVARSTLVAVEVKDREGRATYREVTGGAPPTAPSDQTIWTDSAQGAGPQSITFSVQSGSWTVVVMRADGSRGVTASVQAGATFPATGWVHSALLVSTGFLVLVGWPC